ncbi:lys-63-specific deubiquitinase BRCC36-like isoform X2 [Abrus precatorius]|uniref:Lys-63-specific deubiquitinase BRCC36-like isoform X2 n=1 Tax=Abrus precatorius TaxID=3816 RepID=A0A8B8KG40_ABRPR|nr:lys-63-specific deubiquitinase BRCC36-like isoform X2 [Abrus precatorius]
MSLTSVKMSEEVWLTCVTHALSTETEEIMGLLLGDIQHSKNGAVTALIWGASPQTRSDRRKDRVETNPEQLAAASALADRMTASTGRTTRVIDVRTQAMYQLLDSGFIGLIFSCYSEDVNKVGRIQVIAFQSSDGKQNQLSRPIPLSPVNRTSVIDIDSSPSSSENVSIRSGYFKAESPELDTGDSRTVGASKGGGRPSDLGNFFANADANYLGREKGGENYHLNNSDTNIIDVDPMDMSESMQEAMHRSNLDVSGAEFVRREIPLYVLPALSLINLDSPLLSYKDLQHVLFEEERAAYNQAILQNMRDGKVHPLTFIHHTSTYQASLCKLIEYCLSPAISVLQDRLRENETRLAVLSEEAKSLEAEAYRGSEASLGSPRQVASPVHRGGSSPGLRNLHSSGESLGSRNVGSPGSRSRKGY